MRVSISLTNHSWPGEPSTTRVSDGETAEDLVRRAVDAAALGIDHLVFVSVAPWTPARRARSPPPCRRLTTIALAPGAHRD